MIEPQKQQGSKICGNCRYDGSREIALSISPANPLTAAGVAVLNLAVAREQFCDNQPMFITSSRP